nr:probable mannitol dehydrogenase [Tanacetum cinerariifolium]
MTSSPDMEHPVKAVGYAARDASGVLSPINFSRRYNVFNHILRGLLLTGDEDVRFKVLYCGVCHSDLHSVKNDWLNSKYPLIPGHEIVGVVTEVGSKVKKVKIGDNVGVGCLVGSFRSCDQCAIDQEQLCPKMVLTYNATNEVTYGGYSDHMVANQHFIVAWPKDLPLDSGAPLLCAGITVYSPMRYYGLDKPGMHVGVVGLGGLGHVTVMFLKALGIKVTVISHSPKKKEEAISKFGADSFLVSRDQAEMEAAVGTMDGIIDTVSADHPLVPLISLLKPNGKLVLVGVPSKPHEVPAFPLLAEFTSSSKCQTRYHSHIS